MGFVAASWVSYSAQEVASAIASAWIDAFGSAGDPRVLAILLGQSALESGRWRQVLNNNLAGIKRNSDAPDWTAAATVERVPLALRAG